MRKTGLLAFSVLAACGSSSADRGAIAEAKKRTEAHLLDPNAAEYQNVRVVRDKEGHWTVCGEINAKNALGGYTGFRKFAVFETNPEAMIAGTAEASSTGMSQETTDAIGEILLQSFCEPETRRKVD
jgi:hypothetical protein